MNLLVYTDGFGDNNWLTVSIVIGVGSTLGALIVIAIIVIILLGYQKRSETSWILQIAGSLSIFLRPISPDLSDLDMTFNLFLWRDRLRCQTVTSGVRPHPTQRSHFVPNAE